MGNFHRTAIGGQAVIEGVMMRGIKSTAIAVRKPDGEINLDVWENASIKDRFPILKLPILRGVVNFAEMLVFGFKSLSISAEIAGLDEEEPDKDTGDSGTTDEKSIVGEKAATVFSILVGFAIALLLFSILPSFITYQTDTFVHYGAFKTLVEGGIRIAIFLIYLVAISLMKDVHRLLEYHGAEHKTIHCYEHGEELMPENVKKYTRLHPRCGTSFLLIVMIVSILVFSLVTWSNLIERILIKLLLLPLVVGISYEIIKFAGRHDNSAMRVILAPGLWLQKLTTREPDESQMEVAIASLKAVLTDNREDDNW